ncbi:MAG TPA: outer membrane lipoprotein carrier protein LolA [Candidatus Sulfotelmatobacter sp.]|nr:outer membrane lipoprotein carrier protein LolA [Candidatus Sulfotelmatobacter sp.]
MVSIHAYLAKGGKILKRCLWIAPCFAVFAACADSYETQFNQWFAAQANMQTWSADFTQTRSLMALSEPLKSTGRVWVEPGRFRWELGHPPETVVIRNPDELLILYPRFKRAEIYALNKIPPGPLKDAMALLDVSIPRNRAALEDHFQLLSAMITNSVLQMTLQPKSSSARQFINSTVMGFHTNDYVIADSQMNFSDGSTLRNDFSNVVFNERMDPKLFATNLPPDYTVVEPMNP